RCAAAGHPNRAIGPDAARDGDARELAVIPMRISTTVLESFRLYMQPDNEWMDEAELIATIRGEFTPTPEILLGQAFHSVIEHPDKYRGEGGDAWMCRDFTFPGETIQ